MIGAGAALRAFTLVELLVVIVLLGLLAATAAVGTLTATDAARLRGATLQIGQVERLVSQWAAAHRRPAWLQYRMGTGQYRLVLGDERTAEGSTWRSFDGVIVERAAVDRAVGDSDSGHVVSIRVLPNGVALPHSMELRVGASRRTIWCDGITGEVEYRDGPMAEQLSSAMGGSEHKR